jgi:hypothetical protein
MTTEPIPLTKPYGGSLTDGPRLRTSLLTRERRNARIDLSNTTPVNNRVLKRAHPSDGLASFYNVSPLIT